MKTKDKFKMMFFAPDEGDGDGGNGGEELSRGAAALTEEAPPAKEIVEEPKVETPAAPAVDVEKLAKAFGQELRAHQGEKEKKGVDDLTPEEAAKILNVWQPSKEWITKFDNLETREAALKELRDGVVKNSDTITQHRLRELRASIDSEYGSVKEFMQNYQNEQTEARFTKAYPVLADGATMKVVKAVADDLVKNGKKFDDEASLFKALAEGTEAVIKVHNPNFKLSAGSNPANKTNKGQSVGGIPVTTPGASGGTGGKGGDPAKPRGLAIFEK